MKKNRWIDIVIIGMMVAAVVVSVQYYINYTGDRCVANPLVYGAKELETKYGYPFKGSGTFIIEGADNPPVLFFDSDGISISEPS